MVMMNFKEVLNSTGNIESKFYIFRKLLNLSANQVIDKFDIMNPCDYNNMLNIHLNEGRLVCIFDDYHFFSNGLYFFNNEQDINNYISYCQKNMLEVSQGLLKWWDVQMLVEIEKAADGERLIEFSKTKEVFSGSLN